MNEDLKQLSEILTRVIGNAKNYDPRTEDGYRNIVDKLAEIRKDAKNGMWRLYATLTGTSIEETLDDLYKRCTEIYNEANKVVEQKAASIKNTVTEKVDNVKERLNARIDAEVSDLVDDYLDELIGDKQITVQDYKRAKQSLVDFSNWVLNR